MPPALTPPPPPPSAPAIGSKPADKVRLAPEDSPNRGRNYIPADLKTTDGKKPHGVDYFTRAGSSTIEGELTKGGVLY